jgi:hypothetical protein
VSVVFLEDEISEKRFQRAISRETTLTWLQVLLAEPEGSG